MINFKNALADYVLSGHALIAVKTHEKDRALLAINECAQEIGRGVLNWCNVIGWKSSDGTILDPAIGSNNDGDYADNAIKRIPSIEENNIFVLKDFGRYLLADYGASSIVCGWLQEIKDILSNTGKTIIFLGPEFVTPTVLQKDITIMEFDLPDKENILKQVMFVCESVTKQDGSKFEPSKEHLESVINSCRGMTQQQVIDRVALALRKHKDLNTEAAATILHEKAAVIRESGLLDYIDPPSGGLENVGGYDNIKSHVMLDKPCFSEEARNFGIDYPKGILLTGVPGTGKTLLSIAIASEFNIPLISMDIGNLLNKYVGESEANLREAIKIIEQVAPCVVQLDEVEKAFGNGDLDGGASTRLFGTILKWLNDKTSPVYVIATSNNISVLPPEFSRKGRFDEIFGLDLPSDMERHKIIEIHLLKKKRDPSNFRVDEIVKITDTFTGADIEQTIKMSLKLAFSRKQQLETQHILEAATSIVPMMKSEPERIKLIQEWCRTRAKPASVEIKKNTNRRIVVNNN